MGRWLYCDACLYLTDPLHNADCVAKLQLYVTYNPYDQYMTQQVSSTLALVNSTGKGLCV